MYAHLCLCMHIYVCTSICIYIFIYTQIYIYLYVYNKYVPLELAPHRHPRDFLILGSQPLVLVCACMCMHVYERKRENSNNKKKPTSMLASSLKFWVKSLSSSNLYAWPLTHFKNIRRFLVWLCFLPAI